MAPSRLRQMGADARSIASIVGAIGVVSMAAVFLASYRDIPERTKKNQENIEALKSRLDGLTLQLVALNTLLTQSLCLQKAEKLRTNWQDCLVLDSRISIVAPVLAAPRVLP